MVGLMVNPPKKGQESYGNFILIIIDEYIKEKNDILSSLKRRALTLVENLNKVDGVSCNNAQGAMYAFPKIIIPEKACKEALSKGKKLFL